MKNLNEFGVQELRSHEESKINGGGILPLILAAAIAGYKYEAMQNGNKWYEFPF